MKIIVASLIMAIATAACLPVRKPKTRLIDKRTIATENGRIHIMPKRGPDDPGLELAPAGANLKYFGGPVLSHVELVPIFWGAKVASSTQQKMPKFLSDYTQSPAFDWLNEYNTTIPTGTNQVIGRGSSVAPITITQPAATNLTDATIQSVISQQINAATLPTPTPNTLYAIYLPPGTHVTEGGLKSCVVGGICAYHGTIARTGGNVIYAVMLDQSPGSGCDVGCGGGTMFDSLTATSSHEIIEAVTDPAIGLTKVAAAPLAWYDEVNGEIGDICNSQSGPLSINNTTYSVQPMFSNKANECIITSTNALAPPPDVTQLLVQGQTNAGFTLNWHSGLGSTAGFRVSVVPGISAPADCNLGVDVGTSETYIASQLQANTSYSVRVCSYDAQGLESTGVTATTKTGGGIPTAKLTANSLATITSTPGSSFAIAWSSTNGSIFSSTQSVNSADLCGTSTSSSPWIVSTANGTTTLVIKPCQAGHTYLYTFAVDNGFGGTATTSVQIVVPAPADPKAILTVNALPKVTVAAGTLLNFKWSSANAVITRSSVSANTVDNCGGSTTPIPWIANSTTGTATIKTSNCQAGHTYTYSYAVTNALGVKSTASVVVVVSAFPPTKPILVLITSPVPNAKIPGSNFSVNVDASAKLGIKAVKCNATFTTISLGTLATAPFTYVYPKAIPPGSYQITCTANDKGVNVATDTVLITVTP